MYSRHQNNRIVRILTVAILVLFTSLAIFLIDYSSSFFRASIVGVNQHDAFDGTVYPVQKVPNWVKLTSDEYDADYNSIPSSKKIDIPWYDPVQLKISTDTLKWGDPVDDNIRNAKITYSVPYMGNYELDGHEYGGSHLAVDLKIPMNTPIYSIANGSVIKSKQQTSGFGNHIVIQHNNFPDLNDSSAKSTLYSSYSHMNSLSVTEGDVVKKGQIIGYSGNSGTSTTPHLHFQIDNENAPWHPFWPFTYQEALDAGYDFYSAINAGFGKDLAMSTTVNPIKYVQTYLDGDVIVDTPSPTTSTTTVSEPESDPEPAIVPIEKVDIDDYSTANLGTSNINSYANPSATTEAYIEEEEPLVEAVYEEPKEPSVLQFDFQVNPEYNVDDGGNFTILLRDQYGSLYKDGFAGDLVIKSENGKVSVQNALIKYFDFENGRYKNSFRRLSTGKDRLIIEFEDQEYTSDWFDIIDSNSESAFTDVDNDYKYFDAITYLSQNDIITGYPDGSFKPDQSVSRVEALKLILEGIKSNYATGDLPFSDTSENEWYHKYLYTAHKKQIVDGYEDGTFKPGNTVNRAEFYKILFNGMNVSVAQNVNSTPFEDVDVDDWFAPYVTKAKEMGIVDNRLRNFRPGDDMTRGEVAEAMYRVITVID